MNKAKTLVKQRAIWAFLVLMLIFFSIMSKNFLSVRNLLNVVKQVSIYGIASVGMTYVILLGGIDLATGSIISFVNILAAYLMVNMGVNPILAVLISLVASTLIGFLNGIIIAEIKMPALIVTFASQTIFAGLAYIICNGTPISRFPDSFLVLGQGYVGPIPIPVILMVICFAIGAFILIKTYFGSLLLRIRRKRGGCRAFWYPCKESEMSCIFSVWIVCRNCRSGYAGKSKYRSAECRSWI